MVANIGATIRFRKFFRLKEKQDRALIARNSDKLETIKKEFKQTYSIWVHRRAVLRG
ncbi:hypothetical protein LX87_04516 [Larkinella arboricola]|uniref:Uncharacterized protein n=1 Tax=Larkinella arboricola TaxID=643671 RepID=A0A327WND0_LARAB|nr:hypothetical protein LX87_04516 [Larkinella arboricola]